MLAIYGEIVCNFLPQIVIFEGTDCKKISNVGYGC